MRLASRICDAIALALVAFVAGVLAWHARYAPELGYDESAAWLGVRLFRDFSFGNDIDPAGMFQFQRAVFMDVYPPVYYIVSGLVFLVTGFGIEQARWASILFVAGTGLASYAIGRRLAGPARDSWRSRSISRCRS
jgi:hypothetical protein